MHIPVHRMYVVVSRFLVQDIANRRRISYGNEEDGLMNVNIQKPSRRLCC